MVNLRDGAILRVGSRKGVADLAIEGDPGFAPVHLIIRCEGDNLFIEDAGSFTGTFVKGRRIRRHLLQPGEVATASGVTIRLTTPAGPAPPVRAYPTPVRDARPAQGPSPSEPSALEPPRATPIPQTVERTAPAPQPIRQERISNDISLSEWPAGTGDAFRKGAHERVFAVLDLARDRLIYKAILTHPDKYESLYEGKSALEFTAEAPYLVELDADSRLFGYLRREGWGKSWGVYLISPEPFPAVRRHLRRFLLVKLENDGEAYFRFYDPRVLRSFLPVCTSEQAGEMFAAVSAFVAESEDAAIARRYEFTGSAPTKRSLQARSATEATSR